MKQYTLAIQSSIICKEEAQFEFMFRKITERALKIGSPDKKYRLGSCLCAEFTGQLTAIMDTSDDFREISSYYRREYDRNADLRIKIDVTDEIAFPYMCSYMASASRGDITLTDENGLVFTVHDHSALYGNIPEKLRADYEVNLEKAEITVESIFPEFDSEMDVTAAVQYAEEHFNDFIYAREHAAERVFTTRGYELGIACPSLIKHRVIGGHKRGRIIKRTPEKGEAYCIIGYDSNGKPLFFTDVNSLDTRTTEFFFDFDGFTWAMELHESDDPKYNGKHSYGIVYKFRYDSMGRIEYYASIDNVSIFSEKYQYPCEGDIICHFYYYVPHRNGCSRNIPAGYENSPMSEWLCEISPDLKRIREYDKKGDKYVFSREITAAAKKSKNPKPVSGSFEKFSKWLDGILDTDIPESGGVYFDICEPFEDGVSLAFEICPEFDRDNDDWACSHVYETDFIMLSTDGQLEWDKALRHIAAYIRKYLREGEKRKILKRYQGIGVGLSDSDITYIR